MAASLSEPTFLYLVIVLLVVLFLIIVFNILKSRYGSIWKKDTHAKLYCRHCGAKRVPGSKFCEQCGKPF